MATEVILFYIVLELSALKEIHSLDTFLNKELNLLPLKACGHICWEDNFSPEEISSFNFIS